MESNINDNVSVLTMLDSRCTLESTDNKQNINIASYSTHTINQDELETNKQNVIWTKKATLTLLNIYEAKLETLDHPKRKTQMWLSMAEELKSFNIEVTPDQVRWKINALTKKYKDSLDNNNEFGFKYYNEMHQILGSYNSDTNTYRLSSDILQDPASKDTSNRKLCFNNAAYKKFKTVSKSKIEVDKQWLHYLERQEAQRKVQDKRYERSYRLRQEELELKKKELEMKQTIALKKIQLKEKHLEEMLKIEKEKCILLQKLLEKK